MNFAAILAALENLPTLFDALKGIIGLFHHSPSAPPQGTSTSTIPPSEPQTPTPVVIAPPGPPVAAPAPSPAPVVTPSDKWLPGALKIIDSTVNVQGDHVHVDQPFPANTHLHLDHNLLNQLPWPDKLENVAYDYLWDGQKSASDPCDAGSIDPDGYAGRFNIHDLPDKLSHKLEIALVLNGVHGPWLLLAVRDHTVAGADDGIYHAGFYRCEDSGLAFGRPATGVKVAIFYNGSHKELATNELPYSAPQSVVDAWIATNPPLGAILKSPFHF